MRPTLTWINSFDIQVGIGTSTFTIPGNKIHARLKNHENMARARQTNIEEILRLENELNKTNEQLQSLRITNPERLQERVSDRTIDLLRYMFEQSDRSEFTKKFRDLFMEHLEKRATEVNRFFPSNTPIWIILKTNYIDYFLKHEFDISQGKNSLVGYFLNTLKNLNIGFFDLIKSADNNYRENNKVSSSPSKLKTIEHKVKVFLEDYQKIQISFNKAKEEEARLLQEKIATLQNQPLSNAIEENIVIAEMGVVVEIKTSLDSTQTYLKFIHFPLVAGNLEVHNISYQFDQKYNYTFFTNDGKQTKRNDWVDKRLFRQCNAEFNKQLDYHSERDLYLYMEMENEQFKEYFVQQLKKSLQAVYLQKIHFTILDLHSSRYMCDRCQQATQHLQDPNGPFLFQFSNFLIKQFANKELIPDNGLKLITRVSADIEFDRPKVSLANHISNFHSQDITANTILAMDTSSVQLKPPPSSSSLSATARLKTGLHAYTLFTSGESNDPTRNLVSAYNRIAQPVYLEASNKIKEGWKFYKTKQIKAENPIPKEEAHRSSMPLLK